MEFAESWNHHRLSTEHHLTPYQLFSCYAERRVRPPSDLQDIRIPDVLSHRVTAAVDVPRSAFQPCPDLVALLAQLIDPLGLSHI